MPQLEPSEVKSYLDASLEQFTIILSSLAHITKLSSQLSPSIKILVGFPGGTVVKNLPANARDTGSSPGPGRSHMPRSN